MQADLGTFVHGVVQMGPGKHYMAEGTTCSWPDFLATWSKVTGKTASYRKCSMQELAENSPDRWFGEEIAVMFDYSRLVEGMIFVGFRVRRGERWRGERWRRKGEGEVGGVRFEKQLVFCLKGDE